MAKRRRNKKPNIPDQTLARARRQAGVDDVAEADDNTDSDEQESNEEASAEAATPPQSASRRRRIGAVKLERSRRKGELTNEMIEEVLANPTTFVTEEQMQEEYQHVLLDLRNMGTLAAALMVLLVILAQFI